MALTSQIVIDRWIKSRGIVGGTEDVNLREILAEYYEQVRDSHLLGWLWDFLEFGEQLLDTVSTDANTSAKYMEIPATFYIVSSVRNMSSGSTPAAGWNVITPVDYAVWNSMKREDSSASTNTEFITRYKDRLYGEPPFDDSDSKMVIGGITKPHSLGIYSIPDEHMEAIIRYLNYKMGEGSLDEYIHEAERMGGKPLIDFWGVQYGFNKG